MYLINSILRTLTNPLCYIIVYNTQYCSTLLAHSCISSTFSSSARFGHTKNKTTHRGQRQTRIVESFGLEKLSEIIESSHEWCQIHHTHTPLNTSRDADSTASLDSLLQVSA